MRFKKKRKEIEKKNKDLIDEMLKEIKCTDLCNYFKKNISNYRSEALRNVHYNGNIRVKYIGFNFSLFAIFWAYFGIYFNLVRSLYSSQLDPTTSKWWIGLIILICVITIYSFYFIVVMLYKSYTISFENSNLSHYKVFDINFPKISNKDCFHKFRNLIQESKENLIKSDLRTLLKHYFYQANYQKVGVKLRKCLYRGIILFFIGVVSSIIFFLLNQ